MACYKITYLNGDSYMNKNSIYISDAIDEHDAIDIASYSGKLNDNHKILDVELIYE